MEAKEKVMKFFWVYFHSIMFLVLIVICVFTEIASAGKEICNNEKHSNDKKEHSIGETIMMIIIMLAVVFPILFFVLIFLSRIRHSLFGFGEYMELYMCI